MHRASRHVRRSLAWILLIGAALRIGACVSVSPTPLMNDEVLYHKLPLRIARGEGVGDAGGRPPAALFLHAALYRVFGGEVAAARSGNVALSIATIALVFSIGRRLGGDRSGLIAAGIAAAYPVFIAFSHYLFSETLYVFLLLAAVAVLVSGATQPGWLRVGASGLLFGACALTREVGLAAPIVAAAFLVWTAAPRPRAGLRLAGVLLAATAVVVVPWSLHLNRYSDSFVLVSRTTWLNLYLGNHEAAHFLHYAKFGDDRAARERVAREIAIRDIRERLPAWPLEKTVRNVPRLLRPTAFPVRRLLQRPETEELPVGTLGSWAYRFRWQALDRDALRTGVAFLVAFSYLAVVLAGTAGLALAPERRLAALLAALALAHVVPVIATFASTRFRVPVMPMLVMGASVLVAAPAACWRGATRGQRATAVGGLVLLLACLVSERAAFLSPTAF